MNKLNTILFTLLCAPAISFAETHVVEAHSMTFEPDVVTVQPGDVIRWEYVTGYPHDVTSGTKCSHDGYLYLDIPSGGSVEWTVPEDAPSEIPYFCELHCGNGMTGMINVEGDSEEGRMSIGIIDISSCDFGYTEGEGSASFSVIGGVFSSFAWGVEIEDGDIEVIVVFSGSCVPPRCLCWNKFPLSLRHSHYTLLRWAEVHVPRLRLLFELLTWPEQGDEEGMGMSIYGDNVTIHSSSSDGDNVSFRAPGDSGFMVNGRSRLRRTCRFQWPSLQTSQAIP